MDIDIDMANCIGNQHTEDIANRTMIQQWNKLNTTMEKRMSRSRKKNRSQVYTKRKIVQRKLEL